MKFILFLVALSLSACAPVAPTPPPGPDVATIFTRGTFDCALPIVDDQRAELAPKVEDCLCSTLTRACQAGLVPPYQADAVACAARALGMEAFVRVAEGTATDRDLRVSFSSRQWIQTEGMGFR